MIVIDLLIALMFVFGIFKGFKNGFVISVISLIALIAGAYVSLRFSFYTKNYLEEHVDWSPNALTVAAFVITFLSVLVGLHFLGQVLTKMINVLALGLFNKLGGALFEAFKVLFIISIVFLFFQNINHDSIIVSEEKLQESYFYKFVQKTSKVISPHISTVVSIYNDKQ